MRELDELELEQVEELWIVMSALDVSMAHRNDVRI